MSKFEKIIIPLIDETILFKDLSPDAGFIDSYTSDLDNPADKGQFFLTYNADLRTKESIDRARRFSKSKYIRRSYIKYVDNKPLLVYSFWVTPAVKVFYNGILHLTTEQKARILQFWGPLPRFMDEVLSNKTIVADEVHIMPLEDYRSSPREDWLIA